MHLECSDKTYRQIVLDEMDLLIDNLSAANKTINSVLAELNNLETNSILKRLEWSSNANPSLNEARKSFEIARSNRNNFLKNENKLFESLTSQIYSWALFEKLREKDSEQHGEFLKLFEVFIKQIETFDLLNECNWPKLNDVELNIVQFKSFKDKKLITYQVIQENYKILYEEIVQMKKTKKKYDKDYASKQEEMGKSVVDFKAMLNQHHKIMSDIKPLLKQLSRFNDNNTQFIVDYSKVYHSFCENCQILLRNISFLPNTENISEQSNTLLGTMSILDDLKNALPRIYESLTLIRENSEKPKLEDSILPSKNKNEKNCENKALQHVTKHTKSVQECNSYAISVWKRVNQKLEGRDFPGIERVNEEQQVFFLILIMKNFNLNLIF
jgi:PI-3-kinase-related kinase SMG-1